jgi:hypothetical protein
MIDRNAILSKPFWGYTRIRLIERKGDLYRALVLGTDYEIEIDETEFYFEE